MKQQVSDYKKTFVQLTVDVTSSFNALLDKTSIDFAHLVTGENLTLSDQLGELYGRDLFDRLPRVSILNKATGGTYEVYVLHISSSGLKIISCTNANQGSDLVFTTELSTLASLKDQLGLLARCVNEVEG